jgi:putative ABC transport system permease protein
LRVGETFKPYHGLYFDKTMQHDEIYTVVGLLKPSNSPSDRVIWTSADAVYRMKGHVLRGTGKEYEPQAGKAIPDESKEVSAVMLRLKNPMAGFILDQTINKQGKVATLAWPIAAVMADLFERLGWVYRVLGLVSALVVVVACGSILASLYNALQARRRDLAILRALGAGRRTLSAAILAEAGLLAFLGSLLGYAVYLLILALAASLLRSQTGVVLSLGFWHPALYLAPLGVTLLGLFAGLVPAWSAYATDVAENLKPLS